MKMTLERIKQRREELQEVIADHQTAILVAQAEIRGNQHRCDHPNQYNTCCMGDSGVTCPDCGWGV